MIELCYIKTRVSTFITCVHLYPCISTYSHVYPRISDIHIYLRISIYIFVHPHIYAYICVYPRISTNIHIYTRISTLILYICAYPRISSHDYGVETVANPSAPTREWLDLCRSLLRPATRPVAMVYIINIYHNLVGGFVG